MLDLVIKGGEVVDGTGSPRRHADIGIHRGHIVSVGRVDERAERTIDAAGKIVAPGFVDVHTHYDAQAFWDPSLSPSPFHGVTTVLSGNCGFTIAPLDPESADYLMRMLARVEGMPLASLKAGVPWDWRTTGEYLDRLEGRLAVNAGFMVGHSAIRRVVMGPAAVDRTATRREIDAMRVLLRAGLSAGGLGFSSSNASTHSDGDGLPVPSRHADRDEFTTLAEVCGEFPGTSLEFLPNKSPFGGFEIELMSAMSSIARRPLNWNLLQPTASTRDDCLAMLEAGSYAAQRGAKVVGLAMPFQEGMYRRSFMSGFSLDAFPGWAEPMALPVREKLAMLRDPVDRRRLDDLAQTTAGSRRRYLDWGAYVICETFSASTTGYQGRLVREIAAAEGKGCFDALVDIVCTDELRTVFGWPLHDDAPGDWEACVEICRDHRVVIGGSDAGAHLDSVETFKYPSAFLQRVRRNSAILGIEEAIRLLTSEPAQLYGLRDRGCLRPGAAADIVVLDETTIAPEPITTRYDLPDHAGRLYGGAVGIDHVIVNGVGIVDHGEFMGRYPGTVIRSGRDTFTPALQ